MLDLPSNIGICTNIVQISTFANLYTPLVELLGRCKSCCDFGGWRCSPCVVLGKVLGKVFDGVSISTTSGLGVGVSPDGELNASVRLCDWPLDWAKLWAMENSLGLPA